MTKLNNFMKKLNMAKVNEASSFKYVTKDGEERTYVRKMHSINKNAEPQPVYKLKLSGGRSAKQKRRHQKKMKKRRSERAMIQKKIEAKKAEAARRQKLSRHAYHAQKTLSALFGRR